MTIHSAQQIARHPRGASAATTNEAIILEVDAIRSRAMAGVRNLVSANLLHAVQGPIRLRYQRRATHFASGHASADTDGYRSIGPGCRFNRSA